MNGLISSRRAQLSVPGPVVSSAIVPSGKVDVMRERLCETLASEFGGNLGDATLVFDLVVELEVVERPRVETEAAAGREIACDPSALQRREQRARQAVEKGLASCARNVEVKSPGHMIRALLEQPARRDAHGAERGRKVVDPQIAVRSDGAASMKLNVEATHDVERESRVR